jgi:hypothetical protein
MDKNDLNPEAIYDITGINVKEMWEYYFTKLFPEHVFTVCWVGKLKKVEGELSSRDGNRLIFMRRIEERFRTFRLYWAMFAFQFHDGKIEMFIGGSINSETRVELEEQHLEGKDWLEAVYGQPDENVKLKKNEVIVTFAPRTFEDLNPVIAREFTQDEMDAIDNAATERDIEKKLEEIEELRDAIK